MIHRFTWSVAGVLALGLVAAACGTSEPSSATSGKADALTTGDGTSYTLEGCRNNGRPPIFPPYNPPSSIICPDASYTTGNLGKGWNELDLVPHRITVGTGQSAPASQTFAFAVAVDSFDGGHPGYDVLSTLTLNTSLSSAACTAGTVGPQSTLSPGVGGTDVSLYRIVTLTQAKNLTCVYDFYARLALGSHLYPGSSLHANALNDTFGTAGIGARDVSIPVKEILPQELHKDMSASQGSDHIWTITKKPSPAHVDFTNTCDKDASNKDTGVTVTVSWEKLAAVPGGPATIVTHVYAKNPASRVITVNVTDKIYAGTDQTTLLDTANSGDVDVAANTTQLVLTHTFVWNSPNTSAVNDVATATYTDKVTGVPVPGNTTATASATIQFTGPESNASATINDTESISGTGLTFSTDSFSGASGSFDGGYVAGTPTTGPVSWTSASQSGSGSVLFDKTVYVTANTVTSGKLTDTATLNGSSGFTASATGSIDISAEAKVSITIDKTISAGVLVNGATQTFYFDLCKNAPLTCASGDPDYVTTASIMFAAGDTSKSATVTGLDPSMYTVQEQKANGWNSSGPQTVDVSVGEGGAVKCSGTASFTNSIAPAHAQAIKVTIPPGFEAGWTMTITGPSFGGGLSVLTDATGLASFGDIDKSGDYTITEQAEPPFWDPVGPTSCTFTVTLPADSGKTFSCTFTNKEYSLLTVLKTMSQGGTPTSWVFSLYDGSTLIEQETVNAGSGAVSFSSHLYTTDTYTICEPLGPGWSTTWMLDGNTITPVIDTTNSTACYSFKPAGGTTLSFSVDNRPPPGGGQRTIGYWKNWNSCTNFKPYPTAHDKGFTTLDDVLPITVDNVLTLNTCSAAVSLLSKRDICSGVNRASDPAYGLAAQLVGAIANVKAGATDCGGTIEGVITQAQNLLSKYGFLGCGSYKNSMTAADKALALSLATMLDTYNNGSCSF